MAGGQRALAPTPPRRLGRAGSPVRPSSCMMSRPMTIPTSAHGRQCIKCGREIGPDETVCEICNRAGMATPSSSQYHGTVAVAIVLAVAALAVAASLSLRGVGPYGAEVSGVTPAGSSVGYAITYE